MQLLIIDSKHANADKRVILPANPLKCTIFEILERKDEGGLYSFWKFSLKWVIILLTVCCGTPVLFSISSSELQANPYLWTRFIPTNYSAIFTYRCIIH